MRILNLFWPRKCKTQKNIVSLLVKWPAYINSKHVFAVSLSHKKSKMRLWLQSFGDFVATKVYIELQVEQNVITARKTRDKIVCFA